MEPDVAARRPLPSAADLLDAVGAPAAVLAGDGEVVAANLRWRREVAALDPLPAEVLEVVAGQRSHFEAELPVREEDRDRWVQVQATELAAGALVVLHDVTARRMLEATLRGLGGHEAQTGLIDGGATLEVLSSRLATARQVGRPVSLLQIDVHGVAQVRRDLGAPVAAEVMVEQVARVRRATRDGDVISRTAEAQMVLICTGLGDVGLDGLAGRLVRLLEEPCTAVGGTIELTATVGRVVVPASWSAADALDALDDDARQRAAGAGRAGGPPSSTSSRRAPERAATGIAPPSGRATAVLAARSAARSAAGPAVATFRPVVAAGDGSLIGVEIVPGVAPSDAATSVARLVAAWRAAAPSSLPMVIVPAPAGWERDPDASLGAVWRAVEQTRTPPEAVVLAVGGGSLAHDPSVATAALARLRTRGVRILLDDVASVSIPIQHLVGTPLDVVRLDAGGTSSADEGGAGHVASLSARTTVLRALLGAADPLGLEVLVEGVDPAADGPGLAALGVRYVQADRSFDRSGAEVIAAIGERGAIPDAPAPLRQAEERAAGAGARPEDVDGAFRALAHEVRTPLTVAMGYASLLESSEDAGAASAALRIRRAAERIEHVLRNVEDVRSIDQGTLQLAITEVDLGALVLGVVAEQRDLLGAPVSLLAQEGTGPHVLVDEMRIVQVLANLLSNAVKFSPPGELVQVSLAGSAGWAEVRVADRGPGIPAAQLARAFAKYGRTDVSRPGSGLGLFLAQGIARAHGGDIAYRHRAGGGSEFSLVLPRATSP